MKLLSTSVCNLDKHILQFGIWKNTIWFSEKKQFRIWTNLPDVVIKLSLQVRPPRVAVFYSRTQPKTSSYKKMKNLQADDDRRFKESGNSYYLQSCSQ